MLIWPVAPLATESQPSILAEKALTDRIQLNGSGVRSVPPGQRQKYLITEETAPAPLGSSLGWLMQIDGDSHRNACKSVLHASAFPPIS